MEKVFDIVHYFLYKDTKRKLFDSTRMNNYLHIAQNLYIVKTGHLLFSDDLYAYDNGAVVPQVQENYSWLCENKQFPKLSQSTKEFLDKIYILLENATIEELIEISHEDNAWREKCKYYSKCERRMNSLAYAEEYKRQYRDVLKLMDENL